jgi:hypothetical protein
LVADHVTGNHGANECTRKECQQDGHLWQRAPSTSGHDDVEGDDEQNESGNPTLDEHLHEEIVWVLVVSLLVVNELVREVRVEIAPTDAELVRPADRQRVLDE